MSRERTLTRPNRQTEEDSWDQPQEDGGRSPLREQAAGFHHVAQMANHDCEHGADAERELQRRAQPPGQ